MSKEKTRGAEPDVNANEKPPAPPDAPVAVEAPLTPDAHARETDNIIRLRAHRTINGSGLTETFTVAHRAAAQVHGWEAHKQATTTELLLSRADYLAALQAAADGGEPHQAALSEYAPKTQPAEPKKIPAAQRKARR